MVGEDRVMMSVKELRRVHVIRQAMEKKLTQKGGRSRGHSYPVPPDLVARLAAAVPKPSAR